MPPAGKEGDVTIRKKKKRLQKDQHEKLGKVFNSPQGFPFRKKTLFIFDMLSLAFPLPR